MYGAKVVVGPVGSPRDISINSRQGIVARRVLIRVGLELMCYVCYCLPFPRRDGKVVIGPPKLSSEFS